MDSSRKCSRCGSNGHNSRTCNGKELKLFGVRIWMVEEEEEEKTRKKRTSAENLGSSAVKQGKSGDNADDSLSDGRHVHEKRERKRGIPWSEEEHRRFLAGLRAHGKGEWRGISKDFVRTRTPTQVASHAQKYFLRQLTPSNKKRRSSLFDAPINATEESLEMSPVNPDGTDAVAEEGNPLPRYYSASSPSAIQVADSSSRALLATPVAEKWLQQRNQPGSKFMAGISYGVKNQAMNRSTQGTWFPPPFGPPMNVDLIPHQFHADYSATDFLQLSLKSPVLSIPSTADSVLIEAPDLELTIGLPKSLESAKLSSRDFNLTGDVRVL